jgi:hypothetical protein
LFIYSCSESELNEYIRNIIEIEIPEIEMFKLPMIHAFKNKECIYLNIYEFPTAKIEKIEIIKD